MSFLRFSPFLPYTELDCQSPQNSGLRLSEAIMAIIWALGVWVSFRSNGACDNAHAGAGVGVGAMLSDVGLLAIPFVAGPCKMSKTPIFSKYFSFWPK
jgi:hypothetical protein